MVLASEKYEYILAKPMHLRRDTLWRFHLLDHRATLLASALGGAAVGSPAFCLRKLKKNDRAQSFMALSLRLQSPVRSGSASAKYPMSPLLWTFGNILRFRSSREARAIADLRRLPRLKRSRGVHVQQSRKAGDISVVKKPHCLPAINTTTKIQGTPRGRGPLQKSFAANPTAPRAAQESWAPYVHARMPLRFLVFLVFLICPDTSHARSSRVLNADNPFNSDGCVHTPSTFIPCMLLVSRPRLSVRAFARRDRNQRGPCVVCSPISLCVHVWLPKTEAPVDSATAFQLGRKLSLPLPSPVACSSCRYQASPLIRVDVQSCTPTITSFAPEIVRKYARLSTRREIRAQHARIRCLRGTRPLARLRRQHAFSFVHRFFKQKRRATDEIRFVTSGL